MKAVIQLCRQPTKSILGLLMITLAVMILCVAIGQAHATNNTEKKLEDTFDTVGIMKGISIINQDKVYCTQYIPSLYIENGEASAQYITEISTVYPEIVKAISQHGLASAFIRDIAPVSYYVNGYSSSFGWTNLSSVIAHVSRTPQNFAMFEITLDEIRTPQSHGVNYAVENVLSQSVFPVYSDWQAYEYALEVRRALSGYTVSLSGRIDRVLSLEESFKDPTGMILNFTLSATTYDGLMEVISKLESGKRYLVYGLNYMDDDWQLRLAYGVDEWDFSRLRLATEQEKELWAKNQGRTDVYAIYDGNWIPESAYNTINTVSLTVKLSAYDSVSYMPIRDENGMLTEIRTIDDMMITDAGGSSVAVPAKEFGEYYKIPSIVPLEGTAEEFLFSQAGTEWKAALERDAVNNHVFPVMGVDDLGYVAQFIMGEARIVEGRKFTDQELSGGATVCVISQELAEANGLRVGDIIHPNYYNVDENLPYQVTLARNDTVINPAAGVYFTTTPLLGEMEYIIVGIYRSNEPWAYVTNEENHYAFTPNTIFVPKASVPAKMQYSSLLQFQTVVLDNGQMENFANLMNKAGFGGFYHLDDQGYSLIAKNFSDYQALSRKVLLVCAAAYGMIALLYLLLFPGSQRKTMLLMESVGAGPARRYRHVFLIGLSLLFPATILGTGAGYLLWDGIIAKMKLSADILVEMELDIRWLLVVSVAQFVLMALLSALVAAFQARPHNLSKRR